MVDSPVRFSEEEDGPRNTTRLVSLVHSLTPHPTGQGVDPGGIPCIIAKSSIKKGRFECLCQDKNQVFRLRFRSQSYKRDLTSSVVESGPHDG